MTNGANVWTDDIFQTTVIDDPHNLKFTALIQSEVLFMYRVKKSNHKIRRIPSFISRDGGAKPSPVHRQLPRQRRGSKRGQRWENAPSQAGLEAAWAGFG